MKPVIFTFLVLSISCSSNKDQQQSGVVQRICEVALRHHFQSIGLEEVAIGVRRNNDTHRLLLEDMGKFPATIFSSVIVGDTLFLRLMLGRDYSIFDGDTTFRYVKNIRYYQQYRMFDDILIVANVSNGEVYDVSAFNNSYPFVRLLLNENFAYMKSQSKLHPFDTTFFNRAVLQYKTTQIYCADTLLDVTHLNPDSVFIHYFTDHEKLFQRSFSIDWYGSGPNPVRLQ